MDCRRLFLARWIRLPRRHMRSRGRVRPDRLRHPRGLRGAAEAQEPSEEIGAVLLKHRQDGGGGEGNLYVHGVMHSACILTGGSGETASTPKIVSDPACDLEWIRMEEMRRRPGDIPEFLCVVAEAQYCEKNRLLEGWMTTLFGREQDRCYTPGWMNPDTCGSYSGEYDGR